MLRTLLLAAALAACDPSRGLDTAIGDADDAPARDTDDPVVVPPTETAPPSETPTSTSSEPVVPPLDTAVTALRINELLADPALWTGDANCDGVADTAADEFVEVVNVGAQSVDLTGVTLVDDFGARHAFPDGDTLAAGEAVVVFGGGSPTFDGSTAGLGDWCAPLPAGVRVQVASSGALGLSNSGDTVSVVGPGGSTLDAYAFGPEGSADVAIVRAPELTDGPMVPHPSAAGGATRAFSPGTFANGEPLAGAAPVDTGDPVDTGVTAPPADTGAPVGGPGPGTLVINELLAAPPVGADAGCDGVASAIADEFVEVVNLSGAALDLGGLELADAFAVRHVFPAGTALAPGAVLVVFGGGSPSFDGAPADLWCAALPAGVQVQIATSGLLGLNDAGDTLTLTAAGVVLDTWTWGAEADTAQSLVRDPELGFGPMIGHATAPGADRPWSPGTSVSGAPLAVPADVTDTGLTTTTTTTTEGSGLTTSPTAGSGLTTEGSGLTTEGSGLTTAGSGP